MTAGSDGSEPPGHRELPAIHRGRRRGLAWSGLWSGAHCQASAGLGPLASVSDGLSS